MSYKVDVSPLKPYSRGVSIIGVGATPFMITMDNPETNGLGEGELFGYAAIEAMKDADEFLHSKFNPKLLNYLHACNMELQCDGAAAVVVCASDIAHKYCDHPIEVLGIGHSCLEASTARLEKYATEAAYRQVKELTGLTGKDMDLFLTNDFIMTSQFLSAEVCEYLPEGEGWKYARDGRIAFDGDRPINTNGGRCQYGHAHGTSGMADLYEAVKQMRGEMGPTQVKKPVNYAMLRGYGGGQNLTCAILKNR